MPQEDTDKKPFSGVKVYFKIDVYDQNFEFGSEEPWNPKLSRRVLTLMLANEY